MRGGRSLRSSHVHRSWEFSQVRTLPLESSLVFTSGIQVDLFRPNVSLNAVSRTAVTAAAAHYTALGLPYWGLYTDLTQPFLLAYHYWDPSFHHATSQARFDQIRAYILSKKMKTDAFICSTLVWRAYLDGTAGTIDISHPNRGCSKRAGPILCIGDRI